MVSVTNSNENVPVHHRINPPRKRLFHPPAEFSQNAQIKSMEEYQRLYERAKADPLRKFWAELADKSCTGSKRDTVLDWQPPLLSLWFVKSIFPTTALIAT